MIDETTATAEQLLAEAGRLAGIAEQRARHISRDDLRAMAPDEIVAAHARGQLDHLLRGEG